MAIENGNGNAIIHVNGTSLDVYRDRDEVRELAHRLMGLHPAAKDVGMAAMTAVAQLAILVGASPLPGTNEIHVWASRGQVQFQLGINYFRRKVREQGGILWQVQPREMRGNERERYGVGKDQLASMCIGVRADDMMKYIEAGFTPNDIWNMAGATGIGVAGINESKNGRPPIWTALKRAETDIYRQLFPILMAKIADATTRATEVGMSGDVADDDIGDGDSGMVKADKAPRSVRQVNADLFGDSLSEGETIEDEIIGDGDFEEVAATSAGGSNDSGPKPTAPIPNPREKAVANDSTPAVFFREVAAQSGWGVDDLKALAKKNGLDRLPAAADERVEKYRWLVNLAADIIDGEVEPEPESAEEIKAQLIAAAMDGSDQVVNSKQLKYVRSSLAKVLPDGRDRRAVLAWVFETPHTDELTGGQACALIDWIGANKDNSYEASPRAVAEAGRMLAHVLREQGQTAINWDDLQGHDE